MLIRREEIRRAYEGPSTKKYLAIGAAALAVFILAISFGVYKPTTTTTIAEGPVVPVIELSDLQVTACEAADDAGTCDTRLAELSIVSKEDCCLQLSRCCPNVPSHE